MDCKDVAHGKAGARVGIDERARALSKADVDGRGSECTPRRAEM